MPWIQECEKEAETSEGAPLRWTVQRLELLRLWCRCKVEFRGVLHAVLFALWQLKKEKKILQENNLQKDHALGIPIPAVFSAEAACISMDWNHQHKLFQPLAHRYQCEWNKSAAPTSATSSQQKESQTVRQISIDGSTSYGWSDEFMDYTKKAERDLEVTGISVTPASWSSRGGAI